jgi:hypothetical protein
VRLIMVGCEYVGTSSLIQEISGWVERAMGGKMGIHDHWKAPQLSHAEHTKEENEGFLALSPNLRESFQRYHMEYHLSPSFYHDADHTMVGFHIDEAVYAPLYYGYGAPNEYGDREQAARTTEASLLEIARDTVLILLKASPEVIRARMKADPHVNALVTDGDVEKVLAAFEDQHTRSLLRKKIVIDNTDQTVAESLADFVTQIQPFLTHADRSRILTRNLPG